MSGLAPFTARLAGKLSGGMKQKLGLACCLVKSPQLLLLDEPTVGVDPVSRRELWAIVQQLVREDGIGVLLATAYLDEVDLCHEVYMLEKGQVREAGPPEHFHRLVQGRVFVLQPAAHVNPRLLQSAALTHQSVLDATIRSGKVRCVLAEGALHPWEEKEPGKLVAQVEAATPNFEDAFMALSQHQHAVLPKGRRPWEILVGKAIPGIAFGLIDGLLLSLAAVYWFGLPFRGTFLALLLALLLFFISIVGVGLLISSLCMTMQQGLLGAFIFIMPSVILSGFATPIANMPIWLQYVTLANPLRYAVDALRIIFLQGADIGGTWHLLWPLILISLITLPLAAWMFRLRSE